MAANEVARIDLDTRAMRDYARFLAQYPDIARQEMEASVLEALALLEREVAEKTPAVHGLLRGAWTHRMRGVAVGQGLGVAGEVLNPLNYAAPVELGTKPHFPPILPLQDWVERKLGVEKSESLSVAYAIAHTIARRGTKPKNMASDTFSEHTHQVLNIIERAVPRIAARLARGAK